MGTTQGREGSTGLWGQKDVVQTLVLSLTSYNLELNKQTNKPNNNNTLNRSDTYNNFLLLPSTLQHPRSHQQKRMVLPLPHPFIKPPATYHQEEGWDFLFCLKAFHATTCHCESLRCSLHSAGRFIPCHIYLWNMFIKYFPSILHPTIPHFATCLPPSLRSLFLPFIHSCWVPILWHLS